MFIHIDSPNMDDFYCGPFTVEGKAVDEGPGIEELILYVDGVEFDNIELNEAYSYYFEFDVYISSLPIECGDFEIEVVAIDGDRDEESASVDVTICNDDVDPIVVLSTDTEVITSIYQTATITVDVTEDNPDTYSYGGPEAVTEVEGGYEIAITGEQLEEGENIISFTVIDRCGNEGAGAITLTFEPELVLVVTSPQEGNCLCGEISFEAEVLYRTDRAVGQVCFYLDSYDDPLYCDQDSPYAYTIDAGVVDSGVHVLLAIATLDDGSELSAPPVQWLHRCPPTASFEIFMIDSASRTIVLDASESADADDALGLVYQYGTNTSCSLIEHEGPQSSTASIDFSDCQDGPFEIYLTVFDGWCGSQDTDTMRVFNTINVPAAYPSIQAGLDASIPGDTVVVAAGEFFESGIRMRSGVFLTSETGLADCTTIDAEQSSFVLSCWPPPGDIDRVLPTSVVGFTLSRGIGYLDEFAGGLICHTVHEMTIKNCRFLENTYHNDFISGGGLSCSHSVVSVIDCAFSDNSSTYGGGASFVESTVFLQGCVFSDNSADISGGALFNAFESTVSVDDCEFSDNTAGESGGGAYVESSSIQFDQSLFTGNASWNGGAIYLFDTSGVGLENCTIVSNMAEISGGALYCRDTSALSISACTLSGNSAAFHGGAILCHDSSPSLENCILAFSVDGDAIACEGTLSAPALVCTDVFGNQDGDWTDCIFDQQGFAGNLSLDPVFCNPGNGDFSLRSDSPCAPENNDCGLLGAWPVGCSP